MKCAFKFDAVGVQENAQKEFIKIINDAGVKSKFYSFSDTQFLVYRLSDYPELPNIVLNIILPFPTTYECEV
jgi:hypothetical protein